MARLNPHRRECHGLLAGAAESVQRETRSFDRPSSGEHGEATDADPLIAHRVAVADDHVVDRRRIEPDASLQSVEHLTE